MIITKIIDFHQGNKKKIKRGIHSDPNDHECVIDIGDLSHKSLEYEIFVLIGLPKARKLEYSDLHR